MGRVEKITQDGKRLRLADYQILSFLQSLLSLIRLMDLRMFSGNPLESFLSCHWRLK